MSTLEIQKDHSNDQLPIYGSLESVEATDTAPTTRKEPDYVNKYDLSRLLEDTKRDVIAHSDGDERLFAAHVGLQRFMHDAQNGLVSPEQDYDQRLQSHLGQIAMREEELGLRQHPEQQ